MPAESTPTAVEPTAVEPEVQAPAVPPKAEKAAKKAAVAAKAAKTAKKAPSPPKGFPESVRRAVAALASLKKPATAQQIADLMGTGKAGAVAALGTANKPGTAVGGKLVKVSVDGPDSTGEEGRSFLFQLTAAGKALAEKAGKAAGGLANAVQRHTSQKDAAIMVIAKAGEPMTCGAMIEAMVAAKLWTPGAGKTPAATLSAVIGADMKGEDPVFKRADRGLYTLTKTGKARAADLNK